MGTDSPLRLHGGCGCQLYEMGRFIINLTGLAQSYAKLFYRLEEGGKFFVRFLVKAWLVIFGHTILLAHRSNVFFLFASIQSAAK